MSTKQENTLIITPNRRLSEWLKKKSYPNKQTKSAFHAPEIMPIKEFIQYLWNKCAFQLAETPYLLKNDQAQHVWQKLIKINQEQSPDSGMMKPLWEAWRILNHYELDIDKIRTDNEDQITFARWASWLTEYYQTNNLVDEFTVLSFLNEKVEVVRESFNFSTIECYAFLDLPPKMMKLFQNLEACNIQIKWTQPEEKQNNTSQGKIFQTEETEIQAMLDWCIDSYKNNKQVACIIPDIQSKRTLLQRKLSEQLPESAVNISSPTQLSEYALISETLSLLQWQKYPLEKNVISQLVQSKYLQLFEEHRYELLNALKNLRIFKCSYKHFLKLIPEKISSQLPKPLYQQKQSFYDWGVQISFYLTKNLWQLKSFTNYEGLLARKLIETVEQIQKIELSSDEYHYPTFLKLLKENCSQASYEPYVNHGAPIQLLGQLEAGGLMFDAIWVQGMSDLNWPPALNPNPFISHHVLTQHDIPNAAPLPTLKFYEKLLSQIQVSSPVIYYSYSEVQGDLPCQKTQLVDLQFENERPPCISTKTITLDAITDLHGSHYGAENLAGGTYALKVQANCPFQYYARHRLEGEPIEDQSNYFDPMLRGKITHQILEKIWIQFKKQLDLPELEILSETIEKIILKETEELKKSFAPLLVKLEQQRLKKLVLYWFESSELDRSPFEVTHTESSGSYEIDAIKINYRIDRIDKTIDNHTYVIDYKTGNCTPNDWQKNPIVDPQLPFYAIALDCDGIYFAQINHKEINLKGINYESEDWANLKKLWQEEIFRLVHEIKIGFAAAKPISNTSCSHCAFPALCRINDYLE